MVKLRQLSAELTKHSQVAHVTPVGSFQLYLGIGDLKHRPT